MDSDTERQETAHTYLHIPFVRSLGYIRLYHMHCVVFGLYYMMSYHWRVLSKIMT